jgi:flagellar hook-associated protein 1 FlgK
MITGHNISNASTPGFNRQEVIQTTNEPLFTGAGFIGQGAAVETVRRAYDEYLSGRVLGAESNASELGLYLSEAKQIDNLLADENAGLSPALGSFFDAVQAVAADPSSIPARQSLISMGNALAARFQGLDQRLTEMRDGVNTQLISSVTSINTYATQLAAINERIIVAQAGGTGQPANDLLDQRDLLIRDLNKEIKVSTIRQGDGSTSVFIGSGQPLVVGSTRYTFVADSASNEDAERVAVRMQAPNGALIEMPESLLQGGRLGGLLSFRSETLDVAQNTLGKVAIGMAQNFNDQHRMGIDLKGFLGRDFFVIPSPTVLENGANQGTGVLSSAIVNSDYRVTYSGGAYTVVRLSDNATVPAVGTPPTYDGMSFLETSTPNDGDQFTVKPGLLGTQRVIADSDNTGIGGISWGPSNTQSLVSPSSDYRLVHIGANTYTLTRLVDGHSWSGTGFDQATAFSDLQNKFYAEPQGFTLDLAGATTLGDSFLIQPTRRGAKDLTVSLVDAASVAAGTPFRTKADLVLNKGTGKIDSGTLVALDSTIIPLPPGITFTYDSLTNRYTVGDGRTAAEILARPWTAAESAAWTIAAVPAGTAGNPTRINLNGLAVVISGVPVNGDKFYIEPNANGVLDNRNAQALGALQVTNALSGNTASYQSAYAQLVSLVGNKTREVEVTEKAQQTLADEAIKAMDGLSGVNLDEEAANLLRYQQAYQAAAKIMDVATKLFDELLAIAR